MATVPLSGTNIHFLRDIPFNNDYKNSRWFTSRSSQTTYFTSKPTVHVEQQMNFQRIEGKHFVAINKSIDELWGTNYLMFQNAQYNNKWFYGFVTKLEYKQRNNTHVHFEIDVLQTWKFDMNIKPSYVIREHRKLWNSDGSPVINTIDEGLDYGSIYETVDVQSYSPYSPYHFLVIAMKENKSNTGEGDETNINPVRVGVPQPLTYFVHPFHVATGNVPTITVGGQGLVQSTEILDVLKGISSQEGAVNNVVTAYITDSIGDNAVEFDERTGVMNFSGARYERVQFTDNVNVNFATVRVKNIGSFSPHTYNLGNKYNNYHSVDESKLLMYPYTVLVLDDFKGNRVEFKNEYITSKNLELVAQGSIGTSNKTSYSLLNYLTDELNEAGKRTISNEVALINNDPQDIPIMNDFLSAYMQGNKNSINTQRNQINFNTMAGAVGSGIGAVASAYNKNPIGVVSSGTNIIQGGGQGVLQLQAIQSKIEDIDNTPGSLTRMGSNVSFDYGNQIRGVYVIKKQIHKEYRKILGDFFNMYGYKTNEVKIPNFRTRQYWNYVQTLNCNILGNFNNEDLQELKNIFDSGITLWHTDDIGNYDLINGVR